MTGSHHCVALLHILNLGTDINERPASRLVCCTLLKGTYIPNTCGSVGEERDN